VEECQGTQSFEEALYTASNLLSPYKGAKCGVTITEKFSNVTEDQMQYANAI